MAIVNYFSLLNRLSGPIAHFGIPAAIAYAFRLNILVAAICGILPDLIDKPLSMFDIGGGRYIGHTLLFAMVVALAFTIWKWKHGIAACIGVFSHLILDSGGLVPWFYPFQQYKFYTVHLDLTEWLKNYLTFNNAGYELMVVAGLFIVLVCLWLLQCYVSRKRKIPKS